MGLDGPLLFIAEALADVDGPLLFIAYAFTDVDGPLFVLKAFADVDGPLLFIAYAFVDVDGPLLILEAFDLPASNIEVEISPYKTAEKFSCVRFLVRVLVRFAMHSEACILCVGHGLLACFR